MIIERISFALLGAKKNRQLPPGFCYHADLFSSSACGICQSSRHFFKAEMSMTKPRHNMVIDNIPFRMLNPVESGFKYTFFTIQYPATLTVTYKYASGMRHVQTYQRLSAIFKTTVAPMMSPIEAISWLDTPKSAQIEPISPE